TQLPDLSITKTHSGNFTPGQIGATYTLIVSNGGAGPTSEPVTVSDALPCGLTATRLSGTGWTCTLATLTCTSSAVIAAGASCAPITLTVNVADNAPPSITNVAVVGGGGHPSPHNIPTRRSSDLTQLPDLSITKTHSGNFTPGQIGATYTLTVSN